MKRISRILMLTVLTLFVFTGVAFADEADAAPCSNGYYRWEVKSVTPTRSLVGDTVYSLGDLGRGYSGETLTASVNTLKSSEVTGTINVSINALNAGLGFSINQTFNVSTSKTSKPLYGDGVLATYKLNYTEYEVVQEQIYRIDGYDTVVATKTCYVYKPLGTAQISFEYY